MTCGLTCDDVLLDWTEEFEYALGRQEPNPTRGRLITFVFPPFVRYVGVRNGASHRSAHAAAGRRGAENEGVVVLLAPCAYGCVRVHDHRDTAWATHGAS